MRRSTRRQSLERLGIVLVLAGVLDGATSLLAADTPHGPRHVAAHQGVGMLQRLLERRHSGRVAIIPQCDRGVALQAALLCSLHGGAAGSASWYSGVSIESRLMRSGCAASCEAGVKASQPVVAALRLTGQTSWQMSQP